MPTQKTTKPLYQNPWAIALFIFIGLKILANLFGNGSITFDSTEAETHTNCTTDWQCTSWSKCSEFGRQTRTCSDNKSCGIYYDKPDTVQTCTYIRVEPDPILISGRGQQTSKYFELEQGITIFQMDTNHKGYFGITLYDENSKYIKTLAHNVVSSFNDSKFVMIHNPGKYFLNVSANGNWETYITQPRNTTKKIPLNLSGHGQTISESFYLNETRKFSMSHEGSGRFSITLYNENGDHIELLTNNIGSVEKSLKLVSIDTPGNYFLDISATGNWKATIE
jgi:hypothetical protein